MSILPTLIYKQCNTNQNARIFCRCRQFYPKFIWKGKEIRVARTILKKIKVGRIILYDFKIFYTAKIRKYGIDIKIIY